MTVTLALGLPALARPLRTVLAELGWNVPDHDLRELSLRDLHRLEVGEHREPTHELIEALLLRCDEAHADALVCGRLDERFERDIKGAILGVAGRLQWSHEGPRRSDEHYGWRVSRGGQGRTFRGTHASPSAQSVAELHALLRVGRVQAAVDLVWRTLDEALLRGDLNWCREFLAAVPVDVPTAVQKACMLASAPAHQPLHEAREEFRRRMGVP